MRVCPTCNVAYPDDVQFCAKDGAALEDGPAGALAATALGPGDVRDTPHSPPPDGVTEPDLFLGKSIGLYKILEPLGRGGMGVVYVAEHVHLGKKFALKVLSRAVSKSKSAVERLRQEAVAASRIDHDNIVDVVNFDETPDGDVYIVMELLRGKSLGDVIKDGPMPLQRALGVAVQIARALQAAHDKGIIHRDVKPENVFLCEREGAEVVKVLDFGISKVRDADIERVRMTKTGELVGRLCTCRRSKHAASPTWTRASTCTRSRDRVRDDDGQTPFTGENYFQLLWKHTNQVPPRLSQSGTQSPVPAELDEVVARALAKIPAERFASMREMHDALAEVAVKCGMPWLAPVGARESATSGARPVPSMPPPAPRRRSPLWGAALGLVVLGIAVGTYQLTAAQNPSRQRAEPAPAPEPQPQPDHASPPPTRRPTRRRRVRRA